MLSVIRMLRRLIKPSWRRPYHRILARLAAWRFHQPSRHLTVIAVTGTDGKTSTATMIAAALAGDGARVGLSSTVWFQVGEKRWLNESHMTMPGRFGLQRLLRQMVDDGCQYAVIESSSEGIAQGRLNGIDVDIAVLTNISPEHIESHGSFEQYRDAKRALFVATAARPMKVLNGRPVKTTAIVNGDDPEASYFLGAAVDQKYATSLTDHPNVGPDPIIVRGTALAPDQQGTWFEIDGQRVRVNLPGRFNVANALQAMTVARVCGISTAVAARGLAAVKTIPGRFEMIETPRGGSVVIDYAVTPAALRELYNALETRGAKRIIAVFGASGGGRDHWKRPELGKIAGALTQHIILTSEDPHDEDPAKIANEIKQGIESQVPVEIIIDRKAAITRALELVQAGDVIALTGMGSETTMYVAGGKTIPWNDHGVVQELLKSVQ